MADFVFDIAKGKFAAYVDRVNDNDPATSGLVVVVLKTAEADATMKTRATLAAVLASSTEADFTGYARKVLTDSDISGSSVDTGNHWTTVDIPDQTWDPAGGATNNTTAKLLVCYDPDTTGGADSAIIPLSAHDWVAITNGGPITAQVNASGFAKAQEP